MRKVTIVSPTEYEALVLDYIGKDRLINFKTVPYSEYEGHEGLFEEQKNFKEILNNLQRGYNDLIKTEPSLEVNPSSPNADEMKEFAAEPELVAEKMSEGLLRVHASVMEKKEILDLLDEKLKKSIEEAERSYNQDKKNVTTAFIEKEETLKSERKKLYDSELSLQAKLKSLQALDPDEFRRCFATGVIKKKDIEDLKTYIGIKPEITAKETSISEDTSLLFLFGPEENTTWIESLFLIFEIQDVFDYLDPSDILTVLDKDRQEQRIQEYEEKINALQKEIENLDVSATEKEELDRKLSEIENRKKLAIEEIKKNFEGKRVDAEEAYKQDIQIIKKENIDLLKKASYYSVYIDRYLSRASVLRSEILSVMQGWVPNDKVEALERTLDRIENETGVKLNYRVEEPSEDDENIPTPEMDLKPGFLQPAWILTYLRGWPSYGEFNPGYLSLIIFCIQFGLMFGDVGQGLIMLVLGFVLSGRFNRGLMYRLGGLLIPMGFSAIIFGFFYDSMFLIEGYFEHNFGFTPLLPNPMEHPTTMMKLVFLIAAIEVLIGLGVSVYNHIREGNFIGILGEHGLGFILYVIGLYLTAMYFISIGMNFMQAISNWTFLIVLAGLILSLLEPIIHAIVSGHGLGVEVIGEGIGGIMMTFVEGLANLFSFLRIVAFAIAHVSLSVAAHALTLALGQSLTIPILIIMNLIALTFEFVSSGVQSLRLLYYEFMGKFYKGEGTRWRPFTLPQNTNVE